MTANATASAGMASVKFILDNNTSTPLCTVPGAGPIYTCQWISPAIGPHTLYAIATDTVPQTTQSATVNVTVFDRRFRGHSRSARYHHGGQLAGSISGPTVMSFPKHSSRCLPTPM